MLMPELIGNTTDVKVRRHPKSPVADLESFRKLAGIVRLSGPAPSAKFLDEETDESAEPDTRAGD